MSELWIENWSERDLRSREVTKQLQIKSRKNSEAPMGYESHWSLTILTGLYLKMRFFTTAKISFTSNNNNNGIHSISTESRLDTLEFKCQAQGQA